jgi:hypothetical protein
MKPCYSYYNCPHCLTKAMCETHQRLGEPHEGMTGYELKIARPELASQEGSYVYPGTRQERHFRTYR